MERCFANSQFSLGSGHKYNDGLALYLVLECCSVVAVFMVINVAWTIILSRRHWSGRSYWLLGAVVWLAAIEIDFAHH